MTRIQRCSSAWLFFYAHFLLLGCGGCHEGETPCDLSKQSPSVQRAIHDVEPVVQVGHSRLLRDIVFSPNKRYFLTTAYKWSGNDSGGNVILWDSNTGDKLRGFPVNAHRLKPLFCLDGQAIVLGGNVLNIKTGKQRHEIISKDEVPVAVSVSADTRRMIVGTKAGKVRVVDLETGETIASFSKPRREVSASSTRKKKDAANHHIRDVGFTTNNIPLAILDHGLGISVWNVVTKEKLTEFHLKDISLDEAKFSTNARYVTTRYWGDTGSSFETTRIYDASSGKQIIVSEEWMYDRESVKFTADGRFYASGTGHKKATLWDLQTGQAMHHFGGHERPIHLMRFLDDKVLETQSYDVAQRWNIKSGKLLKAFRDPSFSDSPKSSWPPVRPLVVPCPDGRTFFCRDRIYDTETGDLQCKLKVPRTNYPGSFPFHKYPLRAVYTADGDKVIADYGSHKQSLSVLYDAASGKVDKQLARSPVSRLRLRWNSDASRALMLQGRFYRLWDVEKGHPIQDIGKSVRGAPYPTNCVLFSDNGKYVYAYGRSWAGVFWDAETGDELHHGPSGPDLADNKSLDDGCKNARYDVGRSALSPDRRLLASWYASKDDKEYIMYVWDVGKAKVIRTLDHIDLTPIAPFFSPDGQYLAIACSRKDQRVVVWDIKSGERLYELSPQRVTSASSFSSIQFLPHGRQMLVNSGNRELTLHDVKTGKLIHRMVDSQPIAKFRRAPSLRQSVLMSPNCRYVIAGYGHSYTIIWNLQTGKQTLLIRRSTGGISVADRFRFSNDGQKLFTPYRPATLWDLESGNVTEYSEQEYDAMRRAGKEWFILPRAAKPVWSADLTPIPDEILKRFDEHIPKNAAAVEWTPDRRVLIVYHEDGCMALWDIASKKPIWRCYQFQNGSRWLTIMPDGQCHGSRECVRYRKSGTIEMRGSTE